MARLTTLLVLALCFDSRAGELDQRCACIPDGGHIFAVDVRACMQHTTPHLFVLSMSHVCACVSVHGSGGGGGGEASVNCRQCSHDWLVFLINAHVQTIALVKAEEQKQQNSRQNTRHVHLCLCVSVCVCLCLCTLGFGLHHSACPAGSTSIGKNRSTSASSGKGSCVTTNT